MQFTTRELLLTTVGVLLTVLQGPFADLHLQGPFRGAGLTSIQSAWNESMSGIEMNFGDIINYFKSLDFKKKLSFKNKFKCCWQNVCDMCPSSQCSCLLLWIHHIRLLLRCFSSRNWRLFSLSLPNRLYKS